VGLVMRVPGSYSYTYTYSGTTGTTAPATTTTATTAPLVIATPTTVAPTDAISTVTGIDPNEVAAATFGKVIPIFCGGMPRMGGHIIFGPTFTTVAGITYASFGVSFGMPAVNLSINREIRELRLDGYKVWTLAEGSLMTGLTFRFYPGSEIQTPDPLVTAAYPAAPVAHKGHACVFIENLALTDFNLKVPFVSAVIADVELWEWDEDGALTSSVVDPADGINLGTALTQLAYSPYIDLASANAYSYGYRTTADFATEGISERVDALIVAEKVSFLDLLGRFARLHLWDIVQRDKLMAIERGSVAPDISLDLTDIVSAGDSPPILIERAPVSDMARELEYSFIDIARDYEINSYTARQMSVPAPSTRSEGKDTIALPVVHTIQEAASWVTLRLFKDDIARETLSFTTSIVGYEIEPGDVVAVDAGFKTYAIRVLESLKGANWTNRIRGEPILRCAPALVSDPDFTFVVFLLGPTGNDGGTTFIDEGTNNHTLTTNGNAQIDTGVVALEASALFDGTGDWIQAADSDDWTLAADNNDEYTVEAFVWFDSLGTVMTIACQRPAAGTAVAWHFQKAATDQIIWASASISAGGSGFDTILGSSAVLANTWYFVAVDKDSTGTIRLYVGTQASGFAAMVDSATPADSSIAATSDVLGIGARGAPGGDPLDGKIEELRITKGINRYGSDVGITIPTERFPRE